MSGLAGVAPLFAAPEGNAAIGAAGGVGDAGTAGWSAVAGGLEGCTGAAACMPPVPAFTAAGRAVACRALSVTIDLGIICHMTQLSHATMASIMVASIHQNISEPSRLLLTGRNALTTSFAPESPSPT